MTAQKPVLGTMADAIASVETSGSPSQQQDVRKALSLFRLHGIDGASLAVFPCDPVAFERACPKYRPTAGPLVRLVSEAGLKPDTYRQLWRAARRLIDMAVVKPAAKGSAPPDAWDELLHRVVDLQKVGLVQSKADLAISPLVTAARAIGCAPGDLATEVMAQVLVAATASERSKLKRALRALDGLRSIADLRCLLPAKLLSIESRRQGLHRPVRLEAEIEAWIDIAAREQIDPDFAAMATRNSDGSRGVYQAALRAYVDVAHALEPAGSSLADLFAPSTIDQVMARWIEDGARAERTHYSYAITLAATLGRTGNAEAADYFGRLVRAMPAFRAGKAKDQAMSPRVKSWCRELLADPKGARKFLSQHLSYYQHAEAAFAAAREASVDLRLLVQDPASMEDFSQARRSITARHLRTVQRFGVMAAYSAIAIEGAPLRRKNLLSLRLTGPRKTFFNHLQDRQSPRAIIRIPVEELKNRKSMLACGEELEPIEIRHRSEASCAPDILAWYLEKIRPLFLGAQGSDCLFPPMAPARSVAQSLGVGTFDTWIAACSSEIGSPLSSHNYRHGQCTLYLADGRGSIDDLARLLGDRPETIRRYYGWIESAHSHARVQQDIARRMRVGNGAALP